MSKKEDKKSRRRIIEYERLSFDGVRPSIYSARETFLEYIKRVEPNVLRHLYKTLYKEFVRAERHVFEGDVLYGGFGLPTWHYFDYGLIEGDPQLVALRDSIFAWSRHWYLDKPWFHEIVYCTLEEWHHNPKIRKKLEWRKLRQEGPTYQHKGKYAFEYPIPDDPLTILPQVVDGIRTAFENHLSVFLKGLEDYANQHKYVPKLKKYSLYHFEWLVRFQIQKMPYEEIFDKYKKEYNLSTEKAVRKAIKQLAEIIDLPLNQEP
jgi:hypothetical protein